MSNTPMLHVRKEVSFDGRPRLPKFEGDDNQVVIGHTVDEAVVLMVSPRIAEDIAEALRDAHPTDLGYGMDMPNELHAAARDARNIVKGDDD